MPASSGSASVGATGSSRTCRTSPRRSSRSSPPRASARSGRRARPSSGRGASSTDSVSSSPRSCSPSPGTAGATRHVDRREQVAAVRAGLPSLEHVVHVPYAGGPEDAVPGTTAWDELLSETGPLAVRPGPVRPPPLRAVLLRHDRAAEGNRPRARRHPPRALQEPRALLRHPPRRSRPVVHDDGLDDVERPRLEPRPRRLDPADRRQPRLPRPLVPVAARRGDARHASSA